MIQIDRSGLYNSNENKNHLEPVEKEPETEMARHIKALIRVSDRPTACCSAENKVFSFTPRRNFEFELADD